MRTFVLLLLLLLLPTLTGLLGCRGAEPFRSPVSIPADVQQAHIYLPLLRRDPHISKYGVAGAALFLSRAGVLAGARLPIAGAVEWWANYDHARWAQEAGILYFPRLNMRALFDADDRLVGCEPTTQQEATVRRIAQAYPGLVWDLFNEPDNRDLLAGNGCIGDDPRFAYRQAATVVHYWVDFIRALDSSALFTCCNELYGSGATYVRGVADAYRELYGAPIPLAAVSLHIYQVDSWDLEVYKGMLRTAIANVDAHPDLRGLPITLTEGILLGSVLSSTTRERTATLLHDWHDWLGLPENDRVVFMAWWVDGLCSRQLEYEPDWSFCLTQWEITSRTTLWPVSRLFDDKRLERWVLSPVGEAWRDTWCNWGNGRLDPTPRPCLEEAY